MFNRKSIFALLAALFLAACGGGGGGSDNGGSDTGGNDGGSDDTGGDDIAKLTGVFIDSAVGGIGYRTETLEGETAADGKFEYVAGETVTFFVGDVELPGIAAGAMITPLDIFETEDFDDPRVTNLARLLQSLDEDGDPENGITLGDAAHTAAAGITLDFNVPTETFAANADVVNLVSNGGGPGTLVSADDALAHLRELSLVGSWTVSGGDNEYAVITFMADGTYLIAEGDPADDSGKPGIEYGSYEWDPLTGEFSVTVESDTNGDWGLSSMREDFELERDGTEFIARETIDGEVDEARFTRIESAEKPLVGGWILKGEKVILLVFTDTHYAHAEIGEDEGDGGNTGPEFGTYTWNPATGEFLNAPERDFNGSWGPGGEVMTIAVEGDELTVDPGDDEAITFARVK